MFEATGPTQNLHLLLSFDANSVGSVKVSFNIEYFQRKRWNLPLALQTFLHITKWLICNFEKTLKDKNKAFVHYLIKFSIHAFFPPTRFCRKHDSRITNVCPSVIKTLQ